MATSQVSSDLKWYQVVQSDGSPIGPDLRARVKAKNPEAALREVMRVQHVVCLNLVAWSFWRSDGAF